jgi:hypothetical protein
LRVPQGFTPATVLLRHVVRPGPHQSAACTRRIDGRFGFVHDKAAVWANARDRTARQHKLAGIEAFGRRLDEILFAAFGAWDAAGAKAFGYP